MRIDHEPGTSDKGKPPAYWPSSGSLRVEKLSARYSDGNAVLSNQTVRLKNISSLDSPEILKDVSFEIAPGERVGVG